VTTTLTIGGVEFLAHGAEFQGAPRSDGAEFPKWGEFTAEFTVEPVDTSALLDVLRVGEHAHGLEGCACGVVGHSLALFHLHRQVYGEPFGGKP